MGPERDGLKDELHKLKAEQASLKKAMAAKKLAEPILLMTLSNELIPHRSPAVIEQQVKDATAGARLRQTTLSFLTNLPRDPESKPTTRHRVTTTSCNAQGLRSHYVCTPQRALLWAATSRTRKA
jgi:hypothetical protein